MSKKKKGIINVVFSLLLIMTFSTCLIKNKKVNAMVENTEYTSQNVTIYDYAGEDIGLVTTNLATPLKMEDKYGILCYDFNNFFSARDRAVLVKPKFTNTSNYYQNIFVSSGYYLIGFTNNQYLTFEFTYYDNAINPTLQHSQITPNTTANINTLKQAFKSLHCSIDLKSKLTISVSSFSYNTYYNYETDDMRGGTFYGICGYRLRADNHEKLSDYDKGLREGFNRGEEYVLNNSNDYNLKTLTQYNQYGQTEYNRGLREGESTQGFNNIFSSVFNGFNNILSVEIFPNITLGLIIGFPLILILIVIILKLVK